MNYKRSWNKKEGCQSLFAKENSACITLEVDALKLKAGDAYETVTGSREFGITILGGKCDITGDAYSFQNVGKRKNVFDGKAYVAYIPRGKTVRIEALSDLMAVIAKCPAKEDFEPRLITPDDVIVKNLGKPGFERETHFLLDERTKASRIYIGENFIRGGQWSGFPGHKHDVNNMPTEGFAEEVYYYEFDKETGYGIQQVYTADRTTDEAYPVRSGDIVEIPKGYHPSAVAPGYKGYLLWMMSCDNRGFFMTTDPEQKWQV